MKKSIKNRQQKSFNERVYEIAAKIPEGKVATYGQIAAMLGNPLAARAVGTAMSKTPEYMDIPCHRVVSKSGTLAPSYAFGGAEKQRELLEAEGVRFNENGCIDMGFSIWRYDLT